MRGPAAVLFIMGLALAGCSQASPATTAEREPLIYARPGDPALDAARAEAVRTLPVFWSKFDSKAPGTSDFMIKVRMATRDGGSEYIWGEPISRLGDHVIVRLVNEPVAIPDVKLGSQVRVASSDIWDWAYYSGELSYGQFTTRVILDQAKPEQRAEALATMAPTPLEPGSN